MYELQQKSLYLVTKPGLTGSVITTAAASPPLRHIYMRTRQLRSPTNSPSGYLRCIFAGLSHIAGLTHRPDRTKNAAKSNQIPYVFKKKDKSIQDTYLVCCLRILHKPSSGRLVGRPSLLMRRHRATATSLGTTIIGSPSGCGASGESRNR